MEIPRHWRLKKQRYALVGEVCPHCDAKIFPPRDVCPECHHEAKELFAFSGKGEIYSYTTIYEAPSGYDANAPYTVALVKLDEGPMVTAQLTDVEGGEVKIGMPVQVVPRLDEEREEIKVFYTIEKSGTTWGKAPAALVS